MNPLHKLQRSKLSTMKRDYQSTKSSTSESESDSHSDSDSESEILTPEIQCEVGRDVVSLEYDVTMVVEYTSLIWGFIQTFFHRCR
jgi:hypothetical protein